MIRPGDLASRRRKAKPEPGTARAIDREAHDPRGLPVKGRAWVIGWLMTGRREGAVCGLGIPAWQSDGAIRLSTVN